MTAIKIVAALFLATAAFATLSGGTIGASDPSSSVRHIETITIPARSFTYRQPGEFINQGEIAFAPLVRAELRKPLEVMAYQVTRLQYQQCVEEQACSKPYEAYTRMDGTQYESDWHEPLTGISYDNALDFIAWLNKNTGKNWRLPTDLEWAAFAAERYFDDQPGNPDDPLKKTLSQPPIYKFELEKSDFLSEDYYDPIPKMPGHFGKNSLGVFDISGNIWEWTQSCYTRNKFASKNTAAESSTHCGVRIVQGKQRAYMSSFVQDPTTGECSVAISTLNLGLRLVRDSPNNLVEKALAWLRH